MSDIVPIKSVKVRAGELIFFFVLIPAYILYLLINVGGEGAFFVYDPVQVPFSATAEEYLALYPDGDVSYQMKFSVDYVRDGAIGDWVLNLWPPALPVLFGLVLALTGASYFIFKMTIISLMTYALASYLIYLSLSRGRFSPILLIACFLPLFYGSFLNTTFLGNNMLSSDFYCFALLAILLSLMFKEVEFSVKKVILIAVSFAGLIYFRSFYYILFKLLVLGSVFFLIVWIGSLLVKKDWKSVVQEVIQSRVVCAVGCALLITWVLLLPWKYYLSSEEKAFSWTVTDQVWAAQWRDDLPGFLVSMNTPCIIEKNICEQLKPFQHKDTWATPTLGSDFYKRLSIATFISKPITWYKEKAKLFHYFWFDGVKFSSKLPLMKNLQTMLSVILLIVCLGLVVVSLIKLLRGFIDDLPVLERYYLNILFLIFCVYNVMVFTFVHFEPRYSVPLKWVTYLFLMFNLKDALYKFDIRFFSKNKDEAIK